MLAQVCGFFCAACISNKYWQSSTEKGRSSFHDDCLVAPAYGPKGFEPMIVDTLGQVRGNSIT